jgi:hypothetical protein
VSPAAADYARDLWRAASRVVVEPNGVDATRFAEKPAMRGPFTVGFVGTLKPWHDTGTLIEAFAILRRDHVPDARLLIVGDGPERAGSKHGSARWVLPRRAVHRRGAGVRGAGMAGADARGDRALSRRPPFYFSPLKLYEYMAAALPVVASDVGDLAQVLDHGRLGLLVPPDDPEALAAELAALAADPDLRDRLGTAARAQVVAHHGWDMIAARVIARAVGKGAGGRLMAGSRPDTLVKALPGLKRVLLRFAPYLRPHRPLLAGATACADRRDADAPAGALAAEIRHRPRGAGKPRRHRRLRDRRGRCARSDGAAGALFRLVWS